MNAVAHRLIFNIARGCLMPVAEIARSAGSVNAVGTVITTKVFDTTTGKGMAPVINETIELIQNSDSAKSTQDWLNKNFSTDTKKVKIMKFADYFLRNGSLTQLGKTLLIVAGILIIYISGKYLPESWRWIRYIGLVVGLVVASVGGYASQASALGLPPAFTKDPLGWRKAKATYTQAEKVTNEESSSTDEHKRSDP